MANIKNFLEDPISEIINSKIFMSPMSGVTDPPFRSIIKKFGCNFMFTEMIDANGLAYNNSKTFKMLTTTPHDKTYGVQILGENEDHILHAAKICEEKGFSLLEFNAACPVEKVIKDGKGSALLKNPLKLGKIIKRLSKEIKIPITVKIRSGWNDQQLNYLETSKIIESEGAKALCIHPRSRSQMYKGMPDHNITFEVKQSVNIPVFASGNIFTNDDIHRTFEQTKCDAVAISRGILGRPWFFKDFYICSSNKTTNFMPAINEIKNIIIEHFSLCSEYYDIDKAFKRMHKHMQWYLKPFKHRRHIMIDYLKLKSFDHFKDFIDNLSLELI